MKKIFALICAAAILLCGCGPSQEATDPTEGESTAPPEQKTVYVHSSITRRDASGSVHHTEYVYNEKNMLTHVVITDQEGTEIQRYQVTCDEYGNPQEWSTDLKGARSSIVYQFDSKGRTVGTYAYSNDTLITSTEYTWSGDLRISSTVKAPAQNYDQRIEYSYDEKGHLIRQDQYMDGTLSAYAICTCDDQGRLLLSQGYNMENTPVSTITCIYGENTETRTTTSADGTVIQRQVMTYDNHNNLLTSTLYDGENNILTLETHTWLAIEVPKDSPRASL
jgi:hypothetical protein